VTIEDDGHGISGQQLQQMRDHIQESCRQILAGKRRNREYGIGVENTIMRLYLYYGDAFRYELESEENAGFRIRLSAEIKKEKAYETNESADSGR
jgi:sensor histidine kinase YesM